MPDIWLVRHGQAGKILGDYDRLSPLGFAQSRAAGASWRHLGEVHRVVHGAMRRHRETYETFGEAFGGLPEAQVDASWNEFDHHSVFEVAVRSGMLPPDPADRESVGRFFHHAMRRWASGSYDADYGEPYVVFQERVIAGFERLVASMERGQRALVFTSGGSISAVCRHALGLEPAAALRINGVLMNTSFTRVFVGPHGTAVASMNVYSHLHHDPEMLTMT